MQPPIGIRVNACKRPRCNPGHEAWPADPLLSATLPPPESAVILAVCSEQGEGHGLRLEAS